MIYIITVLGVLLVFSIEYLLQKHDSKNLFNFFKSVSLYKTIEQILIVVLSATLAILFTNANEKAQTKKQYLSLLENSYNVLSLEEDFIYKAIKDDKTSSSLKSNYDLAFVEALKAVDRSSLYETIYNSTEASLTLSTNIYSEIVYQLGFRQMLLEKIYSEDFTIYGNLYTALDYLNNTDCRLMYLIDAEIEVLSKNTNEISIMNEYFSSFSYPTYN